MTNKERLISLLGFSPPTNSAEGALLDAGIDGAGTYDATGSAGIKTAAIEVMKVILTTPDTDADVPGLSKKYDRDAIRKRIAELEEELELVDKSSVIRGVSRW